jgi:hypothetical protein
MFQILKLNKTYLTKSATETKGYPVVSTVVKYQIFKRVDILT